MVWRGNTVENALNNRMGNQAFNDVKALYIIVL
jgi:hypothetical protein